MHHANYATLVCLKFSFRTDSPDELFLKRWVKLRNSIDHCFYFYCSELSKYRQ